VANKMRCSVCGSYKRLDGDGNITLHGDVPCSGSRQPPRLPKPKTPDDPRRRLPSPALRRAMLERDEYRCKKCGFHSSSGRSLEPNHVVAFLDGGLTTLENLDTLCSTCHAELSWLWSNAPPGGYAKWLKTVPAIALLKSLLVVAGDIEPPDGVNVEAVAAFVGGLTREQAGWLLFGVRR
jgi:5-methylcytosine-specific restriction endonuclease McrA